MKSSRLALRVFRMSSCGFETSVAIRMRDPKMPWRGFEQPSHSLSFSRPPVFGGPKSGPTANGWGNATRLLIGTIRGQSCASKRIFHATCACFKYQWAAVAPPSANDRPCRFGCIHTTQLHIWNYSPHPVATQKTMRMYTGPKTSGFRLMFHQPVGGTP